MGKISDNEWSNIVYDSLGINQPSRNENVRKLCDLGCMILKWFCVILKHPFFNMQSPLKALFMQQS